MRWCILLIAVMAAVCTPAGAQAGLYYSGEPLAELPSQWRGFLSDLRALRSIAVQPTPALPASPLRKQYEAEVRRLRDVAKTRALTADESADLGAVLIRLGEFEASLQALRQAQREHPQHFAVAANLGTAWQLAGDLEQAAETLRHAITLAPAKQRRYEDAHLRLIRLRLGEPRVTQGLDNLFGVRFVAENGTYQPGQLATEERKKLPQDAVAVVQQLAIWLPADARLLWYLGELANAHGDVRAAQDLLEICVGQFGLSDPVLKAHRTTLRDAVAELAKVNRPGSDSAKAEHMGHAGLIIPKSRRPLAPKPFDPRTLPPISTDSLNPLPWMLIQETSVDRNFRPTFPRHLQGLKDHEVELTGFMQPLTDELELNAFMAIEYPTGCWYCEMPEVTGIVLVELPEGKAVTYTRSMVRIIGKLSLNATDPENFLYTIKGARVTEAD